MATYNETGTSGPFRSFEYLRALSREGVLVYLGAAVTTFITILMHADEHGKAYPSAGTVARETGQCVRTVKSHVATLAQLGAVSITKRALESGGRGNLYLITPLPDLIAGLQKGKDLHHADPSNVVQLCVNARASLRQREGKS